MYTSTGIVLLFLVGIFRANASLDFPNISSIDALLLQNLSVNNFFAFWTVFDNDSGIKISDRPYTILAPSNLAKLRTNNAAHENFVKEIILDHIVLGEIINITNTTKEITFETLRGRTVHVRRKEDRTLANDATILQPSVLIPNGALIILDKYLFSDEYDIKKSSSQGIGDGETHPVVRVKEEPRLTNNTAFIENVLQVLSYLKSGVRVFQHFLSKSNVSRLLNDAEEYTVFVPTDYAFHRWHPIDWGFYPFSVPEFTESVIINHFVKGNYRQEHIQDKEVAVTLGGRELFFRQIPSLMVNGVQIVKGDTPILKGNVMFTTEVLFVNESVVSRLHQQHKDKETPPLLAFPWFGAQFLSHAFLALERDKRFSHITRFLNLADLAPHVSGTGYSFFVPVDSAFEELGLDKMPDNYLSNSDGLQILLNHFVKGRLYDKDLIDGSILTTLGNDTVKISRRSGTVKVNDSNIVESEVFVYNLGTMFYIDKILCTKNGFLPIPSATSISTSTGRSSPDFEAVPEELIIANGSQPDVLLSDPETTVGNVP